MGGGPSREEVLEDQNFMWRVQQQQNDILAKNIQMIQDFFKSVDLLMIQQGRPNKEDIDKGQAVSDAMRRQVQVATKNNIDISTPTSEPVGKAGREANIAYTPSTNSLVLLNQASVVYKTEVTKRPQVLLELVKTLSKTITDIVSFRGEGDYKDNKTGAQVPGPLINTIKTLFANPDAIKSVTDGVFSIANILLSSMESNMSVSSAIVKKIEFIAPGLYAATYYATSQFRYTAKGLTSTKNIAYSLSAGGVYLVTSPKLIRDVVSVVLYQEIAESFQKRLKQNEEAVMQFTNALSDSAFFGYKFGFTDVDYNNLMVNLKTAVMKDIIVNFWNNTKDYANPDRTKIWNDYILTGDLTERIEAVKAAYESAYNDLKKYYNDFVLHPPVSVAVTE